MMILFVSTILFLGTLASGTDVPAYDLILGVASAQNIKDNGLYEFVPTQEIEPTIPLVDTCVAFIGEFDSGASFLANKVFRTAFPTDSVNNNTISESSFGIGVKVVPLSASTAKKVAVVDVQGLFYEHGEFKTRFATEATIKLTLAKLRQCDVVIVGDSLNRPFVELVHDMVTKIWQEGGEMTNLHVVFNSRFAEKGEELVYELQQFLPKLNLLNSFSFASDAGNGVEGSDVAACSGINGKQDQAIAKTANKFMRLNIGPNRELKVETHVIAKVDGTENSLSDCLLSQMVSRIRVATGQRIAATPFDIAELLDEAAAKSFSDQFLTEKKMKVLGDLLKPSDPLCMDNKVFSRGTPVLPSLTHSMLETMICPSGFQVRNLRKSMIADQEDMEPATFKLELSYVPGKNDCDEDVVYVKGPGCKFEVRNLITELEVRCTIDRLPVTTGQSAYPVPWKSPRSTGRAHIRIDDSIIDWSKRGFTGEENTSIQAGILRIKFGSNNQDCDPNSDL